eukprot:gnl/Trimastix_PCT/1050.p1 GENE.gnl/Trimastix_PCT/1050~~gnl/Trimastix_PCT/1050.p1  ORF type:complete len:322 (+),score=70.24 gnl/Trimastix_PCT/1050:61-1026(+)
MVEAFRKQLDALMGADRNGDALPEERTHFSDRDVCKYYLCGCCPISLFENTKLSRGECDGIHSDHMKKEYEEAVSRGKEYGYEDQLLRCLERHILECDKRIRQARQRLEDEGHNANDDAIDQTAEIAKQIEDRMKEAEEFGEAGNVDESMAMLREVDDLKKQKQLIQSRNAAVGDAALDPLAQRVSSQQKLRVCDVCGAFLSVQDTDRRLADHFGGRLHIAYLRIREKHQEILDNRDKRRQERMEQERKRYARRSHSPRRRARSDSQGGERPNDRSERGDHERERERERERGDREPRSSHRHRSDRERHSSSHGHHRHHHH